MLLALLALPALAGGAEPCASLGDFPPECSLDGAAVECRDEPCEGAGDGAHDWTWRWGNQAPDAAKVTTLTCRGGRRDGLAVTHEGDFLLEEAAWRDGLQDGETRIYSRSVTGGPQHVTDWRAGVQARTVTRWAEGIVVGKDQVTETITYGGDGSEVDRVLSSRGVPLQGTMKLMNTHSRGHYALVPYVDGRAHGVIEQHNGPNGALSARVWMDHGHVVRTLAPGEAAPTGE